MKQDNIRAQLEKKGLLKPTNQTPKRDPAAAATSTQAAISARRKELHH